MPILIVILITEDYVQLLGACEYTKQGEFKEKISLYCALHGYDPTNQVKWVHTYLNDTNLMRAAINMEY